MDTNELKFICGLILFFIILVGTAGNIISLIVWSSGKRCRSLSGSVYLMTLAVSDTSVLCCVALFYAVLYVFDMNLANVNVFMCKLLTTSWHFPNLVSVWIVVCLTVERVIAVCWPLQASIWTNKRQSVIVIIVVIFLSFLINIPYLTGYKLLPANHSPQIRLNDSVFHEDVNFFDPSSAMKNGDMNETQIRNIGNISAEEQILTCQSDPSSFSFKYEREWHQWFIDFCLLYSAPLAIITTCNVVILTTVYRRHKRLKTGDSTAHTTRQTGSQGMTARVVAISVVHCISVGPYSTAVLFPEFLQNVNKIYYITILCIIFICIWFLNHAVNFFLYSLFGKAFLHDCYGVFCSRVKHDNGATVQSNIHSTIDNDSSAVSD